MFELSSAPTDKSTTTTRKNIEKQEPENEWLHFE